MVIQFGGKAWVRFSEERMVGKSADTSFSGGGFRSRNLGRLVQRVVLVLTPEKKDGWDFFLWRHGGISVFLSPEPSRFKALNKHTALRASIMPTLELGELQSCRKLVYPSLGEEELQRAYGVVGGVVARRIFVPSKLINPAQDVMYPVEHADGEGSQGICSCYWERSLGYSAQDR